MGLGNKGVQATGMIMVHDNFAMTRRRRKRKKKGVGGGGGGGLPPMQIIIENNNSDFCQSALTEFLHSFF